MFMTQDRINNIITTDHLLLPSKSFLSNASRKYNGVTFILLLDQNLTKFLECKMLIEGVVKMWVQTLSTQPERLLLWFSRGPRNGTFTGPSHKANVGGPQTLCLGSSVRPSLVKHSV